MDKGNQSAFPIVLDGEFSQGLTKREYTSILILQSLIQCKTELHYNELVEEAIEITDILLKEL